MDRNDYCNCYCGGCACCEPESVSVSVSEPIDYNAITPEQAAKMLDDRREQRALDEEFKTPRYWNGKSHLAALMARRDGQEVKVVDITAADPEDLLGLPGLH